MTEPKELQEGAGSPEILTPAGSEKAVERTEQVEHQVPPDNAEAHGKADEKQGRAAPKRETEPAGEQETGGKAPPLMRGLEPVPRICELQEAVLRLLRHAVSEAAIKPEDTDRAIDLAVPALRKASSELSPEDENRLWKSYNLLTSLVHPATSDSIWVAEQIEKDKKERASGKSVGARSPVVREFWSQRRKLAFCLVLGVLSFFIVQAYVILLSDVLSRFETYSATLTSLDAQTDNLLQAKSDISEDDLPMARLIQQRDRTLERIKANSEMLEVLSWPWRFLARAATPAKTGDSGKAASQTSGLVRTVATQQEPPVGKPAKGRIVKDDEEIRQHLKTEQAARSALQVTNYYLLPLILGLLGAVAFVVRRLLESVASKSYTLGTFRTYQVRIGLGALLGIMSGIIWAPIQSQVQSAGLSLVLFAFLMGYSVEFAFSAFDALIARGHKALQPNEATAGAKKG